MNYESLIPVENKLELMRARDDITRSSWAIGRACEATLKFCQDNGIEILIQDAYAAVGSFSGKASRTCRDYHSFWLFYPPAIQERYSILSFDHFVNAARIERAGGEKALVILEWAEAQVETLNRPATVDAIIARFGNVQPVQQTDDQEAESEPEESAVSIAQRNQVTRALHIIREALMASKLPEERYQRAFALWEELAGIFEGELTNAAGMVQ